MKFEFNWPSISEEKMFENVDGRTDDGWTTDAGGTGILIAHLGAFGSGELKREMRRYRRIIWPCFQLIFSTF